MEGEKWKAEEVVNVKVKVCSKGISLGIWASRCYKARSGNRQGENVRR